MLSHDRIGTRRPPQTPLQTVRNRASLHRFDAAPPTTLHPALDRVLRRCPLLPAEVERIEGALQQTLEPPTPAQLCDLFGRALASRPSQEIEQVRQALRITPGAEDLPDWQDACRRLLDALLQGLHRLYLPRALGMGLYAVTNRLLGEPGVQALHWAQQTHTAAMLLAQDAWLPWLQWLGRLPLPSLRDGGWLEPLLAALPIDLGTPLGHLDDAHALLQRTLTPPSSPVRLLLLATVWALWRRHRSETPLDAPPRGLARGIASLPACLEQLDLAGSAARRLFAAPAMAADAPPGAPPHATLLLPVAAAAAALLPAQRRVPGGAVPVAAVGLALAGFAHADPPATSAADADRVAVIEALWSAWDAAATEGPVPLAARAFEPAPEGDYLHRLQQVRDLLVTLYHQDDFLGALYIERITPATLQMRNATLTGQRVHSQAPVQLHPPTEGDGGRAWSTATGGLLNQVQAAVARAGGCYVHAGPRLDCALRFHLGEDAPDDPATAGMLAGFIARVERTLPNSPAVTDAREAVTLRWLRVQIARAKAAPVRGLEPSWPSGRPDPRSHLGDNLRLARSVLARLSAHPMLVALCVAQDADPDRLVFPARGAVVAASSRGNQTVRLFLAEQPPPALAALTDALRGLAMLLQAPVRSSGTLQVPEMLAYYDVPWPGAPLDDAPFDACLAALDRRLAPPPSATETATPPVSAHPQMPADRPARRHVQQATVDQLWHLFDAAAPTAPVNLAEHALAPLPGSRMDRAWALAQTRLLRLFEASPLWLRLRQADASFHGLRVASGRVIAAARADGRRLLLNTSGWGDESAELRALFHLADQFGCIAPSLHVPLSSVLSFHGIARLPPAQACQPHLLASVSDRLQLLHQIHVQWSPHRNEEAAYQQANGDLHDVRHALTALRASGQRYRPTLGTASAGSAYGALGPFALLLGDPGVQATLAALNASTDFLSIDGEGHLTAHARRNATFTLAEGEVWANTSRPTAVLDMLRSSARRAGRTIRSDGRVDIRDVLSRHGDCHPDESAGNAELVRCSERILGELRLGMRPHLVHAQDLLVAAQEPLLRDAIQDFLQEHASPETSLLEYLGTPLVEDEVFAWHEVGRISFVLSELVRSPRARALQGALLKALGWYEGDDRITTSPTLLGSLTVSALVADLGPPSRRDARIVLGYRLHKFANRGRTFAEIRDDLDTYLYSLGRVPHWLRAMAVRLVLQEEVPELLAADIPKDLVFGSPIAAVNYVSGVHIAERIQRGLSQRMNFSSLLTLSTELAGGAQVPADVRRMALDARRLPLLDWLAFRGMDENPFDNDGGAGGADAVMRRFDARIAEIDAAITDLLAPPPYRMQMVKSELERVFPAFPGPFAGLDWNTTQLRLCHGEDRVRRSFPLFELVAADALQHDPRNWSLCGVPEAIVQRAQSLQGQHAHRADSYAQMRQQFTRLDDIGPRFRIAFDAYFANATRGYGVLIEEALYRRPIVERMAILRGDVEIYTLRTHEPHLEAQQETAADTDPYRLRFGVVYRLVIEGRRRYFQLFPLQSRIIPLELDGPLPLGGRLESRKVRLRNGHYATVAVRRGTPLKVDARAYASNDVPEPGLSSTVIVEPLRFNASLLTADPAGQRSPFHALVAPLQQAFFWLDPVAFLHQARSPTSYESHLAAPPLWLNAVEFIVPFVGNLRKLSSKDRDEFANAAFGLYLEGVLVVGPVGSGLVKALGAPGTKMTLPRFKQVAQVLGRGTLDALNPLSGMTALARLGVNVVQRGARGDLHFIWSRLPRPQPHASGWRWALRDGMAVLQDGAPPPIGPLHFSVRTVENLRDVLVVSDPSASAMRGYHLLDPASLAPYGPLLLQRTDSSNAAGMLLKVGDGLRAPRPSPGKMLKPIKQGARTSQEASSESRESDHPQQLDLADPFLRRPTQRPPQGSGGEGG